jgi:cytochrome bd-type quinol oxidase subunit 2
MISVYLLIYIPILLFVLAFVYETWLSAIRLFKPKATNFNYVDATWEVTNTLLVFGVVMLLMLFTKHIDMIAKEIFLSTLLAGFALLIRAVCYIYIFYVKPSNKIGPIDWLFALTHVAAAGLLVITVIKATLFLITEKPDANTQFLPFFWPGLIFVLALCAVPLLKLYATKK